MYTVEEPNCLRGGLQSLSLILQMSLGSLGSVRGLQLSGAKEDEKPCACGH